MSKSVCLIFLVVMFLVMVIGRLMLNGFMIGVG